MTFCGQHPVSGDSNRDRSPHGLYTATGTANQINQDYLLAGHILIAGFSGMCCIS